MPYYMISSIDDPLGESYWIQTTSPERARWLLSQSVKPAAAEALDVAKFDCVIDSQKQPPEGVIYTGSGETHTVNGA